MIPWRTRLTRSALDVLHYTAGRSAMKSRWCGTGVIFTLHHIQPPRRNAFSPNRILAITPEFLDKTLQQVRDLGYDIVSLDEARRRLLAANGAHKFVCFTLDDGYLDNYTHALPIFEKHQAPFTVYISTGLPDGTAMLWWEHLEEIIDGGPEVAIRLPETNLRYRTNTPREKYQAYDEIYWAIRALPHRQQQTVFQTLIDDHGIEPSILSQRVAMSWDTIKALAANALATIGAHTITHPALSKLSAEEVRHEALKSRDLIAKHVGYQPKHFAYPYGDATSASQREFEIIACLDFDTATTTRKGVLFPEHANHLHALPRVSLNGDYQEQRYVRLFLSGVPFAIHNRMRRLNCT